MTADYETLIVQHDAGVATVTLDRPEVMNAIDLRMAKEIPEALWSLDRDESVRCVVVTGAGKAFCAGWDLSRGAGSFGANAQDAHDRELGVDSDGVADRGAYWKMRTPTIAAINGAAVGAGLTSTLRYDILFAAEDAKLRFPFTRLGITPEANVTWLLPRLVGVSKTCELLFGGRFFTGREAERIGLVSRALPREEVLPAALDLAHDIADNTSPLAVGLTKELVYRFLQEGDRASAFALETKATWWAGSQPDASEGTSAFLEKRAPRWRGSKHAKLPEELR